MLGAKAILDACRRAQQSRVARARASTLSRDLDDRRWPTRFCCLFRAPAGIALGLLDHGGSANFILVPASRPTPQPTRWRGRLPLHRARPPLPTSLTTWIPLALVSAPPPHDAAE
jgi:hypothetical protein